MGTTYNDSGKVTQRPLGAFPIYARVKRSAGGVEIAGAADKTYGTALYAGYAQSTDPGLEDIVPEPVSVKLVNAPGSHFAIASETIPEGAEFEAAADGKIALLDQGTALGIMEEPGGATEDGHICEVVYY